MKSEISRPGACPERSREGARDDIYETASNHAGHPRDSHDFLKHVLVLCLAWLCFGVPAAWAWEIERFEAHLDVQRDGTLLVRERIDVDFQGEDRHGIYRDIPLVTQDRLGVRHSIRLTFLGATDDRGRRWETKFNRIGAYQRVRLGSADVTYKAKKTFTLTYRVERILQSFPDHDEFYWNVTGNGWAVPIRQASATVKLPAPIEQGRLLATAYTGSYGSFEKDAQVVTESSGLLHYTATRSLNSFEGLTLVVGWPRGIVSMPTLARKIRWFFQDNRMFGIPIVTLFVMWGLWWQLGRDPKRQTITVQYEPPEGLTPAEVGTLVDDQADMRDITATIVDLARRGYLKIEQTSDDYKLIRESAVKKSGSAELKNHEQLLLASIFPSGQTTHLSDLENKFYKDLPKIRQAIYQALIKKQCWRSRPDAVRTFWWGAAGTIFALTWVGVAASEGSWPLFISISASAGIVALFAPFMPRKTRSGVRALEQILGLEEFLRRTDQDRLRRESNPQALFEQLLPYAMVLGVANQWAKAFEGIYQIHPTWYSGVGLNTFSPSDFTHRISSATARMGTVLASVPRSSGGSGFGGGFSGGGGGGGGGGAW